MNIPRSITLAGINVEIGSDPKIKEQNMIGQAAYAEQKILLDFNLAPQNTTEQAFWHETIHWILFIMGESKLRTNERFIDMFAHLLYQIIETGQYKTEMPYENKER